jgi:hypothetical protein
MKVTAVPCKKNLTLTGFSHTDEMTRTFSFVIHLIFQDLMQQDICPSTVINVSTESGSKRKYIFALAKKRGMIQSSSVL